MLGGELLERPRLASEQHGHLVSDPGGVAGRHHRVELGSRKEIEYVHTILREGTSADRQLAVHDASGGDMRAVVDHVAGETMTGVPLPA